MSYILWYVEGGKHFSYVATKYRFNRLRWINVSKVRKYYIRFMDMFLIRIESSIISFSFFFVSFFLSFKQLSSRCLKAFSKSRISKRRWLSNAILARSYIPLVSINYVPLVAPISSNFQWYIFPPINGEPIVENLSTMAENEFRFDRPRNS